MLNKFVAVFKGNLIVPQVGKPIKVLKRRLRSREVMKTMMMTMMT